MWCRWVRRDLTAWVDGELAPRRAAFVSAHLQRCQACAAEQAAIRETVAAQRRVLPRLVDAGAFPIDSMLRRVRAQVAEPEPSIAWWRSPRLMAATATSVALIALAWRMVDRPLLVAVGVEEPPRKVRERPELFRDYSLFEHLDAIENLDAIEERRSPDGAALPPHG